MLYRFMIGKGTATGPRTLFKMVGDAAAHFLESVPEGLREPVSEHLVGFGWEPVDRNEYFEYALFDDEFTQMACELWFPRSLFSMNPQFETKISRCGSPCPRDAPSSLHAIRLPRHGECRDKEASTSQTAW